MIFRRRRLYRKKIKHYKWFAHMERHIINALAVIVVVVFIWSIINYFIGANYVRKINVSLESVSYFQVPYKAYEELYNICENKNIDFSELITFFALENSFFPKKVSVTPSQGELNSFIKNYPKLKKSYNFEKVKPYYDILNTIIEEIQYFPIPSSYEEYIFGDSFGAKRTYGGERAHEGTDIMDKENIRKRLPVVSMTDGVIQNIGWNEKGGFRIGILTDKGTYYYYAHFDSFAKDMYKGKEVEAGEFLGYMGDTGYSKIEGVKGNFPVHLHIGISPQTELTKGEFWINPYIFLRFIENRKVFIPNLSSSY